MFFLFGEFIVSSSHFASKISIFGGENRALAFNATTTLVLLAIRELEGIHLSFLREKV